MDNYELALWNRKIGFRSTDMIDSGTGWTHPKSALQLVEHLTFAPHRNVDRPVPPVAYGTGQAEVRRRPPCPPPESDALDPSAHAVASLLLVNAFHHLLPDAEPSKELVEHLVLRDGPEKLLQSRFGGP